MEKSVSCLLCAKEDKRATNGQEICEDCLDILEFGYFSFPAYHLSEERNSKFVNVQ
jgi:hypothetical protein